MGGVALLLSIGSISANHVIKVLRSLGYRVIGTDIYTREWLPASRLVDDFVQVPTAEQRDEYIKSLKLIIIKYKVNLVLPITDFDVDFISEHRSILSEISLLDIAVLDSKAVEIVRDKMKLWDQFRNSTVKCVPTYWPTIYQEEVGIYPCIVKKRRGRSSQGLLVISDRDELNSSKFKSNDYICQPLINGEIVVADIIHQGSRAYIVCRKERTRTANGAGLTVEIVDSGPFANTVNEFLRTIEIRGCINIEFIVANEEVYVMDVNPRFSAGVVYSSMAGYDFVTNHIRAFLGETISEMGNVAVGKIFSREYVELDMTCA